jgi:DNA-binding NarL/FixJ family response regulator
MVRVLLVHEMLLMCNILTAALEDEPDIRIVGYATTVAEALKKSKREDVEVVLVSTRMANQGALQITRALTERRPGISVLLLGLTEKKERILKYIEAGASGYVLENDSVDDLITKIRAAHDDLAYVSPAVASVLMNRLSELAQMFAVLENSEVGEAGLTPRELEVLELLGQGKTNQEISERLVIEVGTVKNHVHNIFEKLNVNSRAEAAAYLALFNTTDNE